MILAIERLSDIISELVPILEQHYGEVALYKDKIELAPNYELYMAMEEAGKCFIYTAREEGELIGYCVVFVDPHIHYKQDLYAHIDVTYIKQEYRGKMLGIRLFKYVEDDLKNRGVSVVVQHVKTAFNFGPMLERLGYASSEIIFTKCIKE